MAHDGLGKLGFYILATLYLFMALGSVISTAVINKIGTRFCLILGGVGNTIWIFSTILAAKYALQTHHNFFDSEQFIVFIIFSATIFNGLTVGILWAAANNYVASCAQEDNKGFYFSYYWSIYMCS